MSRLIPRSKNRIFAASLMLLLAVASSACSLYEEVEPLDESLAVNELQIAPDPVRLEVFQTTELTATALDRAGAEIDGLDVQWSSANTSVATVNAEGVVEAKAIGDTTITAKVGEVTSTTTVVVFTPIKRVEIAPNPVDVDLDDSVQLSATVYGENDEVLTGRQIVWSSSDEEIATVDDEGLVTGVAEGEASIRAKVTGVTGTAEVRVVLPVGRVEIDPTEATIEVTDTVQLSAQAFDQNDQEQDRIISWSSTQPDIASVDDTGLVEGLSGGQTTIVAESGGERAEATITVDDPVDAVTISPNPATVSVGSTTQLQVAVADAGGNELSGRDVAWESSDDTVATVDQNGLVTGLAGGQVTITATSEGVTGTVQLTVDNPVATVEVSPDPVNLAVPETQQLTATLEDAAGNVLTGRTVNWRSSDTSIATVDSSGLVTAKDAGVVDITATVDGVSDSAQVTVENPVATVEVTPAAPTIDVAETVQLTATAKNSRGSVVTGRSVTWTSSDPTVVAIDSSGVIEGLEEGTATITAQVDNITGTADVTVAASVASVAVTPTSATVEVTDTVQLSAQLEDAAGNTLTGRTVNWTSGDDTIATVDQNGLVTGVAGGTVTITAESEMVTATATITVDDPPRSLDVTPSPTSVDVGSTKQLTATPRDKGGNALTGYTATWSSSDDTIATVDSSGLVTGHMEGSVVITASIDDGTGTTVTGTADVNVGASVAVVEVDPTSLVLFPTDQAQINVTVKDANGNTLTGRTVTWTSQDTNVATVDSSGLVTAGSTAGNTTITAESEGVSATVDLDVVEWTQVATGDGYSCGVLSNGNGYCWGENSSDGVLGNGTTDSGTDSSPAHDADQTTPSLVSGGIDFQMIQPGWFHTCGLTSAGKAYCWGSNGAGHLGNGSNMPSNVPVAVSGSYTFTDISLGANHACALDTSNRLYCWGSNQNGQLGLGVGSASFSSVPQRVPGMLFSSFTTGAAHTCGITQAGDTYCWGAGGTGQVGNGSTSDQMAPVQVSGTQTYDVVVAGWNHTCGVTTANEVYCWGSNTYSELGDGTTSPSSSPQLADASHTYVDLALGAGATCAIDTNADAYCWGFNGQGNLGTGSVSSTQTTPALVTGGYTWSAMALGRQHSCGIASGQVDAFCWGDGDYGQRGDGSNQNFVATPTSVTRP